MSMFKASGAKKVPFLLWRVGRTVRQRSAKPCKPVRLRYAPPLGRVAELVYATDLKSVGLKNLEGSSLSSPTNKKDLQPRSFFVGRPTHAINV
jgi:hypothetical protein